MSWPAEKGLRLWDNSGSEKNNKFQLLKSIVFEVNLNINRVLVDLNGERLRIFFGGNLHINWNAFCSRLGFGDDTVVLEVFFKLWHKELKEVQVE